MKDLPELVANTARWMSTPLLIRIYGDTTKLRTFADAQHDATAVYLLDAAIVILGEEIERRKASDSESE